MNSLPPIRFCMLVFTIFMLGVEGLLARETPGPVIRVDARVTGKVINPELFGINSRWLDAGDGIVEYGEMIRDRSFRNQRDKTTRLWIESENKQTRGKIKHEKRDGAPAPWGGNPSPGYMQLSQKREGYTCISQRVLGPVLAGARYNLSVAAFGKSDKPALSVFFANDQFAPVEELDNLAWIDPDEWSDYSFVLQPASDLNTAYLRVCIVNQGTVWVDEIRLQRDGGVPRVRERAHDRIMQLGVKSIRWPSGSDADYLDWRNTVGSLRYRAESPSAFGVFQTPSWGLHEFLDYCEKHHLIPLITLNVTQDASVVADLVEYILGPSSSPMGKLRAGNGREKPWSVTHFELGNEPTEGYRHDYGSSEAAKGYVELAKRVAVAVRDRASRYGKRIELKGIVETTFAAADWIAAVPILARWNDQVLTDDQGLLPHIDQLKGHFYSAFNWRDSQAEMFREVMSGGTTLSRIVNRLRAKRDNLPPFWLTEYSILLEKKRPSRIQIDRLKDFQTALGVADILMTAIREGFGGAYLFNLAEQDTWGVLANNEDFRIRPAGWAFSLVTALEGKKLLSADIRGNPEFRIEGGDGNSPAGLSVPVLEALAARGGDIVELFVLNRSFDTPHTVNIELEGLAWTRAQARRLGPYELTAHNDDQGEVVRVRKLPAWDQKSGQVVEFPPRSVTRITYSTGPGR